MNNRSRNLVLGLILTLLAPVPACLHAAGDFQATARGALFRDLQAGSGATVEAGDTVTVHFSNWLVEDGAQGRRIYDTRKADRPVAFVVGTDRVMPGWNEGVIGMREGGRRLLRLPPALGYGSRGVEGVVPPSAGLIFIIDLVELEKRSAADD